MEKIVFTQEEIQSFRQLQQSRDQLTIDFGYVEYQIQELELQKENLIDLLSQLKKQEIQIGQEIELKYGKGTVNLETGEFTPV
jgi:stress response protein YsnF